MQRVQAMKINRMTFLHVRTLVPRNVHDAGTLVALYIDGHLVLRERLIIRRVVYIAWDAHDYPALCQRL